MSFNEDDMLILNWLTEKRIGGEKSGDWEIALDVAEFMFSTIRKYSVPLDFNMVDKLLKGWRKKSAARKEERKGVSIIRRRGGLWLKWRVGTTAKTYKYQWERLPKGTTEADAEKLAQAKSALLASPEGALLLWLQKGKQQGRARMRDILRANVGGARTSDDVAKMCARLVDSGAAELVQAKNLSGGAVTEIKLKD